MLTSSKSFWIVGAGVLATSFLLTSSFLGSQITIQAEKPVLATPLAIFASFQVSDQAQLAAAALSAKLKKSDTLKGMIEELTPAGKGRVRIRGWAADKLVLGEIITIVVFSDGKQIYEIQTKGARSDVANSLQLSRAAAANTAFEGLFSCSPARQLMFIAVEANTYYAQLPGPPSCPT